MTGLAAKSRPRTWEDVVGQGPIVNALRRSIEKKETHTYLLHGPSGVGKTTLARIAAKALGCAKQSLEEEDGATNTGIDAMRDLTRRVKTRPLFGEVRVVILDECHRVSGQAFDAVLKATEDPPSWVYWFLCTTQLSKVPKTIQTRATTFGLKLVATPIIAALLEDIVGQEELKVKDSIVKLCASEAQGSPRQAISNLEACMYAKSEEEANDLLANAAENPKAIDLARALIKRERWTTVQKLLGGLRDDNPESVRHVVRAYMTNVIIGAKDDRGAGKAMEILDLFSEPFNSSDGISPLVLACGRLLFAKR